MSASERLRRERQQKAQKNEDRRIRRILRLPEVQAVTGKKRSAIYDGVAEGTFPAPVPLGPRAVGWLEDEVADWQERCIAARTKRRQLQAEEQIDG
jgi:predicted DNA-binding transcriptional regulator AlpA